MKMQYNCLLSGLLVGLTACSGSSQQSVDATIEPDAAKVADAAPKADAMVDGAPLTLTHRLAVGNKHSCAVRRDGELRCWGSNQFGQLGDGTFGGRLTPTKVLGGPYIKASAGTDFTCGLTVAGAVNCWGRNIYGNLGDGTITKRSTPGPVQGLQSGVIDLVAGPTTACAVMTDHTLRCWGDNSFGQLGDGTQQGGRVPVVVAGLSNVVSVATGLAHTCALADGGLQCWGWARSGALGNGESANTTHVSPVNVDTLGAATAVVANNQTTCTPLQTGRLQCWGNNGSSQLGNGVTTESPMPVYANVDDVAKVVVGEAHACALHNDRVVRCWGDNSDGSAGIGVRGGVQTTPVAVPGLPADVVEIDAGGTQNCALTATDRLFCWGGNTNGEIGDGTIATDRSSAVEISWM